ncbi:MAG: sugar ABC transporter permease [Chloroflexi bacterium]|jgi:raffinose/stachyose/melibiose transport system permease protein|nr:sugar ABC transporter permease [Chloroflexota bacterium]
MRVSPAVQETATSSPVAHSAAQSSLLYRGRAWILAIPFLAPAIIFYTLFLIVPLVGTLLLSLTEWSGFNFADIRFVGLENFRLMGRDEIFWLSLRHNLIFLGGAVALKTTVALALALALEQRIPFTNLFRGVFLMPTVISLVVVGVVFRLALSPSLGLINPFLQAVGLGRFAGDFLGNPNRALPILILIDTWHGFGLYMFLFIARLAAINYELHEAAFVDGANLIQDIRHITLPLMKGTLMMVLLLAAIDSLKLFATVYVMTKGGPGHSTEVLSTWAYFQAFTANKVGYGSAILVVLLLITFVLAYLQVTRFQPREED